MLADEIKAGESRNIEFKVAIPKKSDNYVKSIIAFSNTAGGKLIIGIDDKTHEIIGVNKDDVFKIMDGITNTISDTCYPQIFPSISFDTIEEKCVIVVEIFPGACRPYYIKSLGKEAGTFVRVSGTSRHADEAILKDLESQGSHYSFDEIVSMDQKFDSNEADKLCAAIKKYLVDSAQTKSEKKQVKDVTVQNLMNWDIVKKVDGNLVPTNAFILLTSNKFPFAKIQCALFKGVERVLFIDRRVFDGPLYTQIEEAYEFVLKHINYGAEIKGLLRQDSYEIPTEVIREAIINAVTHRNYLDRSCIQVAVYDDRIEITSPGMLYGGLTIEQMKEGGSKIRNRCIAEVFSRMKMIESWGTGIRRMFSICKEYGIREPELLELGDSFRVNIYRPSYREVIKSTTKFSPETIPMSSPMDEKSSPMDEKSSPMDEKSSPMDEKSSPMDEKSSPVDAKSSPVDAKSTPYKLNKTQNLIIDMIRKNPKVKQTEMAEELDITTRAVKKSIREMTESGVLEHVGTTRSGHWQIL
jgi:predicted HTH transcriptional regulator